VGVHRPAANAGPKQRRASPCRPCIWPRSLQTGADRSAASRQADHHRLRSNHGSRRQGTGTAELRRTKVFPFVDHADFSFFHGDDGESSLVCGYARSRPSRRADLKTRSFRPSPARTADNAHLVRTVRGSIRKRPTGRQPSLALKLAPARDWQGIYTRDDRASVAVVGARACSPGGTRPSRGTVPPASSARRSPGVHRPHGSPASGLVDNAIAPPRTLITGWGSRRSSLTASREESARACAAVPR
jgi:hypothetical protein